MTVSSKSGKIIYDSGFLQLFGQESSVLKHLPSPPSILDTPLRKVLTWNFQGILFRNKQDHSWC